MTHLRRKSPRRAWLAVMFLLGVLCVLPRNAQAQSCSYSVSSINFGNVSTISGAPTDAVGTLTANCTGFSTTMIRLCLSFGAPAGSTFASRVFTGPSGSSLTGNLFVDAAHQTIWGSAYSSQYPANSVDVAVVGGNASANVSVYGRIFASQLAAITGSYTLNFGTNDTLFVALGYSGTPPSCFNVSKPASNATLVATAQVVADCNITASPLTFPAATLLNTVLQAASSVQVTCVSGAPYTVALDAGTTAGASATTRLLARSDGGATVNYQLYRDAARTQPWGDGTNGTTTGAGTGNGSPQTFTVYGQVPPQPSQPPGTYTDTVTAIVSF